MPEFSIVIPVYNEGENIKAALTEIKDKVRGDYELLIVYDFEQDSTLPAVKEFLSQHTLPVRLVKNNIGRGVLNALKTGFMTAQSELVIVTMADLSDPPDVMNSMLAAAAQGADVVCASRYMRGGRQIGGPLIKRNLSRLAGLSLSFLTGIPTKDITNNFRLYRKAFLDSVTIESEGGFEVAMELTLKAYYSGYRVAQVPTVWTDRVAGESQFQFEKWLPKYLKWYIFALKKKVGI